MPEKTPKDLTCSCAVDITANESGTGGLFAQFFNVFFHLKGPPPQHGYTLSREYFINNRQ